MGLPPMAVRRLISVRLAPQHRSRRRGLPTAQEHNRFNPGGL